MSCKRNKDLSGLVVNTKIPVIGSRFYWTVYLWKDTKSMHNASAEGFDNCKAFCSHMPERLRFVNGKEVHIDAPKLGELHFVKDNWNLETVAHECRHTEITAHRVLGIKMDSTAQDIDQEERACDYLGKLTDSVYVWLWQVNPGTKWKKVNTNGT